MDQSGSIVQSENFAPVQQYGANISNLTPGNYFVQIQIDENIGGTNIFTYPIIVQ